MSQILIFRFLNLILMVNFLSSFEVYVSSSSSNFGNGTFLNPYQNISQVFQNSANIQNNLTIFLLTSSLPYVINIALDMKCDTSISFNSNNNQMAILDFQLEGSIFINDYFSIKFENLTLQQTNPQNRIIIEAFYADSLVFKVYPNNIFSNN